ncbi:hypothetical protein AQUCO_02100104v1 [Aquilegia coerulea]|uniref:Uncharacterized protein n=1 Tax=Aquilegia coerulea TaxID=218851 RepID=A0A2G5DEU3_AQUCA|nr:hypothetical protein AQUCO_02100104v1 [Aquilegia coerulea]
MFDDSELESQGISEEGTNTTSHTKNGQISFLACHIARELILPTDIHTWALEGVLPYLTAFIDVNVSATLHVPGQLSSGHLKLLGQGS